MIKQLITTKTNLLIWLSYLHFRLSYLLIWLSYLHFRLSYLLFWLSYLLFWLSYLLFWLSWTRQSLNNYPNTTMTNMTTSKLTLPFHELSALKLKKSIQAYLSFPLTLFSLSLLSTSLLSLVRAYDLHMWIVNVKKAKGVYVIHDRKKCCHWEIICSWGTACCGVRRSVKTDINWNDYRRTRMSMSNAVSV